MTGFKKTVVNYLIVAIVIFCSIGYGLGLTDKNVPEVPTVITFQETIQNVLPACVFIHVDSEYGYSWSGSGVIISPEGAILTAGHVVEDAMCITVELNDGRIFEATGFSRLPGNDGGFIKIDPNEPLPYVDMESAETLIVGDDVFIIGCPFGHDQMNTVTKGIVSHTNRNLEFFGNAPMIQVDAASWPGNSGGPVFNIKGELVAILVGGMGGGNDDMSFCTRIDVFWGGALEVVVDAVSDWMQRCEI